MAQQLTPFGLRPVNMIGGQSFTGGTIREYRMTANSAAAVFKGDVVALAASGSPASIAATPVAGTTAGIVGVCVGVRFVDPVQKQPTFAQFLPTNAITNGYTDVWIRVTDDPDQLYIVQSATAVGTLTNGARAAIGKNVALGGFGGNVATGNSTVNLVTGVNWGTPALTATLAMRIVDIYTPDDLFPELIVKFNQGVHSYLFATGV